MKILPGFPTAPKSKVKLTGCILIALLGLFVFVIQIWRIHALWTPVGYVDTWPLYDRLMHWHQGQLSLDHYLFDPHGPHLHFIIYLLYLIDVTCGSGRQLVPHFATLLSIFGLIATLSYIFFRFVTTKQHLDTDRLRMVLWNAGAVLRCFRRHSDPVSGHCSSYQICLYFTALSPGLVPFFPPQVAPRQCADRFLHRCVVLCSERYLRHGGPGASRHLLSPLASTVALMASSSIVPLVDGPLC